MAAASFTFHFHGLVRSNLTQHSIGGKCNGLTTIQKKLNSITPGETHNIREIHSHADNIHCVYTCPYAHVKPLSVFVIAFRSRVE